MVIALRAMDNLPTPLIGDVAISVINAVRELLPKRLTAKLVFALPIQHTHVHKNENEKLQLNKLKKIERRKLFVRMTVKSFKTFISILV